MLAERYPLDDHTIAAFRKNGWIKLDQVLDPSYVEQFRKEISRVVAEESRNSKPLEERDTYDKAFLQITNLWQRHPGVASFTLAKRFGGIAAELLGVNRVRIYHDQALYKEAGGGRTPWHQDQYYWPVDTNNTVTMWMPLVDLTEDMGILQFVSATHLMDSIKSVEISDESDRYFAAFVNKNKLNYSNITSSKAGDASFHYGWTLHYAPGNFSARLREVMTVIYVADGARVTEPEHDAQKLDLKTWFPGLKPGDLVSSHLNPLI